MRRQIIGVAAAGVIAALTLAPSAPGAVAQKGVLGWGADPGEGVLAPDEAVRYVAVPTGGKTLVGRVIADGGSIHRVLVLDGHYAVPAVANDGSPAGLSADGTRLVLAKQGIRFPRRESKFAVVEPNRMRLIETVTLDGTFTFDALSPDGRTLYLIEYVSPRDISRYQVRAYDLRRGRLIPEPIIDAEVAPVVMRGWPVTRASSPDGRWALTLYDTVDRKRPPFIHALDTENGTAACIDLDQSFIDGRKVGRMRLEPAANGETVVLVDRGTAVASVDMATFEVAPPPVETDPASEASEPDGDGTPWGLIGIGALVGVLVVGRKAVHRIG